MAESLFTEARIPQQKSCNGVLFPKILSSNPNLPTELSALIDSIKSHKPWLELQLHQTGAILFRGFPLSSPSDFNDFVEAFGYDELPYLGGAAPRRNVVGRVFTANESPPDQKIPFHHEMSLQPEFPSKLFFFCEVEPGRGGETPIVLSHIIYQNMKERYPSFIQQLEEHGLLYTRMLGQEDDASSPLGLGWKSKFQTHDKDVAEDRAMKLGMKLEWMGDSVKTILGPLPAFKIDKSRNRTVWFNNMMTVKDTMFGNGEPLPDGVLDECSRISDEESVAIPWKKGDVLLVDNLAVLHARRPLTKPPRGILASLCK